MNYEHLSKIRASVALHTNKKTENILDGGFTSIFRGRSLDFDDLREYQQGDNVRDIDWKSSSKTGKTLVRRYIAERKHNVLFVCDSGEKMIGDTATGESKAVIAENVLGTLMYLINRQGDDYALLQKNREGVDFSYFKSGPVHFERLMTSYENNLGAYIRDYDRLKKKDDENKEQEQRKGVFRRKFRYSGVETALDDDDEEPYDSETGEKTDGTGKKKKVPGFVKRFLGMFSFEELLGKENYEPNNKAMEILLNYTADNIRRQKVVFIITDIDGMMRMDDTMLKKLNVTSDVLLIQIDDTLLEGDNVYDLETDRYEDDLLLHNKKLREAARKKKLEMEEEASAMLKRGRISMVKVSSENEIVDRIVELFERHKNETFG